MTVGDSEAVTVPDKVRVTGRVRVTGLQQVGRGELARQTIPRRPEAAHRARLAIAQRVRLAISLAIIAPPRGSTVGGRQVGRRHEGAQPAWWWCW